MALAKITLIGMYKYLDANGDDLFQNLTVPAGMDKPTLVASILSKGAEFETLYADGDFMKFQIGVWAEKWQHTLERWVNALSIEYNPLENYDRYESWSDSKSGSNKQKGTAFDNANATGSATRNVDKAAFDSSSFSPVDKETNDSNNSSSASSQTSAEGQSMENGAHIGHIHGNIGVTTAMQLLREEMDVAKLSVYEEAANLFLTELTIYTY